MTSNTLGKPGRHILLFAPAVIVIVGFLVAIPWLDRQNDTFVMALTAAAAIFVMGYSLFISHQLQRNLDEVQLASAGFASARGWVWGAVAANLVLLLPQAASALTDLANRLSTGSADTTDRGAVHLALFSASCWSSSCRGPLSSSHP